MNSSEIKHILDSKKYRIINLVKSLNYQFDSYGRKKISYSEKMNEKEIKDFFALLNEFIKDDNKLCFVILNEYFFSYHIVIDEECFKLIIDSAKLITENHPSVVLLINLCHKIDNKYVDKKYIQNMELYYKKIRDSDDNVIWNISSHELKRIFKKNNFCYFANETFVFFRGSILYTYKKSTHCNEL